MFVLGFICSTARLESNFNVFFLYFIYLRIYLTSLQPFPRLKDWSLKWFIANLKGHNEIYIKILKITVVKNSRLKYKTIRQINVQEAPQYPQMSKPKHTQSYPPWKLFEIFLKCSSLVRRCPEMKLLIIHLRRSSYSGNTTKGVWQS